MVFVNLMVTILGAVRSYLPNHFFDINLLIDQFL
jgi:hypothetical protein